MSLMRTGPSVFMANQRAEPDQVTLELNGERLLIALVPVVPIGAIIDELHRKVAGQKA